MSKTFKIVDFDCRDIRIQFYCDLVTSTLVIGKEICPTTKKDHLQIFITFKRAYRFPALKKLLGDKVNMEAAKVSDYNYELKEMNYIIRKNGKEKVKEVKINIIEDLYPWQLKLETKLKETPCDRKIIWYTDPLGSSGKSQFAKRLVYLYEACIVGGKTEDMFNGINNFHEDKKIYPRIVIVMMARDSKAISYPGLEMIKDGLFYNSKYQGKQHIFNSPHIVVFSNNKPDYSKLTADRWDETELSHIKKNNNLLESDDEN